MFFWGKQLVHASGAGGRTHVVRLIAKRGYIDGGRYRRCSEVAGVNGGDEVFVFWAGLVRA